MFRANAQTDVQLIALTLVYCCRGQRFLTSRATIMQGDSMLASLFSDRHKRIEGQLLHPLVGILHEATSTLFSHPNVPADSRR